VGAHRSIVCVCISVCVCSALQIIVLYCTTAVYSATGNACPRDPEWLQQASVSAAAEGLAMQPQCVCLVVRYAPRDRFCTPNSQGMVFEKERVPCRCVLAASDCHELGAASLPVHTAGSSVIILTSIVDERHGRGAAENHVEYFEVGVEGRRTRYEEQCSSAERGIFSRLSTGKKQRNGEYPSRRR
jgi:hypothetical protein